MSLVADSNVKSPLQKKVKDYQQELDKLVSDWNGQSKEKLSDTFSSKEREQRANILRTNKTLIGTTKRVDNIEDIANETEEIAMGTISRLGEDRTKLQNVIVDLDNMKEDVTDARSYLTSMTRKFLVNKCILLVIITVLLFGILGVIFIKWIKPLIPFSSPTTPQPTPMSTTTSSALFNSTTTQ